MIYSESCSCGAKVHIEEHPAEVERLLDMWVQRHLDVCPDLEEESPPPGPVSVAPTLGGGGQLKWAKPASAYEFVSGWPEVTGRAEQ